MKFGAQLASTTFAVIVFVLVFEMVRRRRLGERYALLWLAASVALIVLASWSQLLRSISHEVGIKTPANAFFVIAFTFLLLLLLHFSAVASRLADETRVLAQRLALLEQRVRAHEKENGQIVELESAGAVATHQSGRELTDPASSRPSRTVSRR